MRPSRLSRPKVDRTGVFPSPESAQPSRGHPLRRRLRIMPIRQHECPTVSPRTHLSYHAPDWRKSMEHIIAKLLQEFEQGRMSRRQLIQSLAVAASAAAAAPAATGGKAFKAVAVNHISYQVSDYART